MADQNQHLVPYRVIEGDGTKLPAGTGLLLDWRAGYVYDAKGNQVAKWESRDDDRTGLLADYASRLYAAGGCSAERKVDKDSADHMARSWEAILSGDDADEDAVLMDLGPADVHIPSAMPNFASGYKNEPPLADIACPVLLAQKQVDDYWQFDKNDAFQRAAPIAGAGGGQVAEVSPRLANAQYSTKERALGGYVSTQLEANADAPLRILQATTRRVMNALVLEREMRVQNLLRTTANWNSGLVVTLGAGFQWDGGTNSDPVKDLQTRIESSFGAPTGIIMSQRVWHAFIRNPAVRGYYAYKSDLAAVPTPQQMQAILELPPIYVSKMKYINTSGTLDFIWGNDVVLVRQPEEMPPTSQEDVATAYTFRWNVQNPKDGVANGGMIVRQFYNQHRGSMGGLQIVVVHHDAEVMTSQYVGGLIVSAWQ
jgi:hypothetical protein